MKTRKGTDGEYRVAHVNPKTNLWQRGGEKGIRQRRARAENCPRESMST